MLLSAWIALASSEPFDCTFSRASTTGTLYRPSLWTDLEEPHCHPFSEAFPSYPWCLPHEFWDQFEEFQKKKNLPFWDFDWDCHWTYINSKRMKSSGYWIFPLLNVTFLSINCEDLLCFSERVYDTQHLKGLHLLLLIFLLTDMVPAPNKIFLHISCSLSL